MRRAAAISVLRKVFGQTPARGTPNHFAFYAGLTYHREAEFRAVADVTLAFAGLDGIMRAVLVDGMSLVDAGRARSGFKQDAQARAYAMGQMIAALRLLCWHDMERRKELPLLDWARREQERRAIRRNRDDLIPFS